MRPPHDLGFGERFGAYLPLVTHARNEYPCVPVPVFSVLCLGTWRVVWVRPMAPSPGALVQELETLSTTVYGNGSNTFQPPPSLLSALGHTEDRNITRRV